ncbi:hypothetical protein [Photobacterium lipolyticum]|uniref:Uncharacterized protein n=1 Tax=Photobacterium lipolyticum TaxID=266810 RepID=A0A2T3MZN0_9GAMM|nr:hypothetical protein [Photobacterium lipolyticum]PSW05451.1 hypothetical protein C9I89_09385 [Photobacterium lipolyticum]
MSETKQALWELEYRLEHHPDIFMKINYAQLIELSKKIKLGASKKEDDSDLTPSDIKTTLDAFKGCLELAVIVKESEIATILLEQSKNITKVLEGYSIPEIDAQILTKDEIKELVEFAESTDLMEMLLDINKDSLNEKKLESYLKISIDEPGTTPDENKLTPDERNRRQTVLTIMNKAISGGLLSCGNIGLGALSGILSTIPTLTNPTFPLIPGLITSTYTGINGILSALKDLNNLP